MRINIIAIGKIKEKYFSDALAEYVKRCSRFADVRVLELPEAPQKKAQMNNRKSKAPRFCQRPRDI